MNRSPLNNQSGQAVIETVLIVITFAAIGLGAARFMNSNGFIKTLIQSPWQTGLVGMIENGVWGSVRDTRGLHPNLKARHTSREGDRIQ